MFRSQSRRRAENGPDRHRERGRKHEAACQGFDRHYGITATLAFPYFDDGSFHEMTNWLPGEEAAQLRLEFETEIKRLDA